jgi:hypothetical protein
MRLPAIVLLIAVFLSGCAGATRDIKVETESDPKVDLARYKTYSWLMSAKIINDPHGNWEPPSFDADAELRSLITKELRARGMQEVATNPDVVIAFAAGINTEVFKITENPENKMYALEGTPKGALIVVMIDPATRYPIWVGSAAGDVIEDRSISEVRKRLKYAVRTMFRDMK